MKETGHKLAGNYDWVVIGDHPAGLFAAAVAAKKGSSVLVTQDRFQLRAKTLDSGLVFDPEPAFVPGLGESKLGSGPLLKYLRLLGITSDQEKRIQSDEYFPQILSGAKRITFPKNKSDLEKEKFLWRGLSKEGSELSEFVSSPPREEISFWDGLIERVDGAMNPTAKKSKLTLPKAPKFPSNLLNESVFYRGISAGLSGNYSTDFSMENFSRSLVLGIGGARFQGGLSSFRYHLSKVAEKNGVVFAQAETSQLFLEDERLTGIQIQHRGQPISCRQALVYGSPARVVAPWIQDGKLKSKLLKSGRTPLGWYFTLALQVGEDGIPAGATNFMICQEADAPALEISLSSPSDYGGIDRSRRFIYLRSLLPYDRESLSLDFQRTFAARMFRVATQVFPFLESHVDAVYPDFREKTKFQVQASEVYGFPVPELISENLLNFGRGTNDVSCGVSGIYCASSENYPELGGFGPYWAALQAICAAVSK